MIRPASKDGSITPRNLSVDRSIITESDAQSKVPDWRLICGGHLADLITYTNTSSVFFVVYLILTSTPSIFMGLAIAFCTTTLVVHAFTAFSTLICVPAMIFDHFFATDICSYLSHLGYWVLRIHGKVIHGHEILGKENIPKTSGGLIVYHHLLFPYDLVYLMSDFYFEHGKQLSGIIHSKMVKICPGLCRMLPFFSGKESLIRKLRRGEICSVAPGGGYEAVFGDNTTLLWRGRTGFAAAAKECGVPIIPMYTVNGNEATPLRLCAFREFFAEVHEATRRVPYLPMLHFPVKLRTILGEPLLCGENESPEDFAERVKLAIDDLRDRYRRRPGSTWLAFLERFGYIPSPSKEGCRP